MNTQVIQNEELVSQGTLLDYTIFSVQPWMDVENISSAVVTVADDPESARINADALAQLFFDNRDGYMPELMSVDEIIDRAEDSTAKKPVILVDSADSPNGGAVGDSVAVAMRLMERGSTLRTCMFCKDPEAVAQAFTLGVSGCEEFTLGAKFTANVPGPLRAVGKVRSLHDGCAEREGPVCRGASFSIGKAAVVSFGALDVLVCEAPTVPGDPQIFRHHGIEPTFYDLVVVKANVSFRAAYSEFSGEICCADTPGAGAANLNRFQWKHLPKGLYPFDLPEDYQLEKAKLWR